jgi:ABC-type multidrug transport system fused ATPase/permease subunit
VLLGWHVPVSGIVEVDGKPLSAEQLSDLRRSVAWVDPAVQLWNRSLLENLTYGSPGVSESSLGPAIESASLRRIIEALPEGLKSRLGESGGLVSGGEGQRVRFARGLARPEVRIVILDEPFRGLERELRHQFITCARERWKDVTLLCITHDVADAATFDRVLVMENGRVAEDGIPSVLLRQTGSRFRAMADAEQVVRERLNSSSWRRFRLSKGRVVSVKGSLAS